MKRLAPVGVLLCLCSIVFHASAQACAWDSDTLEAEAKGIPDTIRVITGRFERNPDLYYEMRLARVSREMRSTLEKLELYDDAGVACDRLRRGDEAIAWMQQKRAQMEKMKGKPGVLPGGLQEHRYRLLANEGTFVAHRWLRNGARRDNIIEMKRARDLIAAAIKLNPNAHFGREKYQLKAMEWMIHLPKKKLDSRPVSTFIEVEMSPSKAADTVKGLSGLIVLGDAWQSVDVFHALAIALQADDRRSSVAYLAYLRCFELVEVGRESLGSPLTGERLKTQLQKGYFRETASYVVRDDELSAQFKTLRAEADEWHAQRTAYMIERLETGRHPDTDETFWNEWQETPAPSLYIPSPHELRNRRLHYLTVGITLAGVLFVGLWMMRFVERKKAGR